MTYRPTKKFTATIAGISAVALVLTACSSSSTSSTSSSSAAGSSTAASAAASGAESSAASSGSAAASTGGAATLPATTDWCQHIKDTYPDISGKTVGVYTTIVAPEDTPYINSWKEFTECTGVTPTFEGTKEFEAQVIVRIQSGNPPDVGIFPQPGLLSQIVNSTGSVKPLTEDTKELGNEYFPEDWMNYGTVNDIQFAIPNNADFKSMVWYSPKTFAAKGYTVPTTWEELTALTEQIAATGEKPWCIGIKSGEATGWQITDWLEEYVLRTAGPDVYDQWVNHEIPFNDPQIAEALKQVGDLIKNPKYVNAGLGDVATIASTEFNDVAPLILNGSCTMAREAANFDSNYKSSKIGPDGDIDGFYFPPISTDFGQVVL
ncbi:MAG: ABC transporter substrate-binding protein, partial [Nakamurella sp.]